jgi:hypothetical protein
MVSLPDFARPKWDTNLEVYLNRAVRFLPATVREEQRREIEIHIREMAKQYVAQGYTDTEALRSAIRDFGNPDTIGKQMAREMWQMEAFYRESSQGALRSVGLWCGLPVTAQCALFFTSFFPVQCQKKHSDLFTALIGQTHDFLMGAGMPLLLFLLIALPVLLGVNLSRFDRKRIVFGWATATALLFCGGLISLLLNRVDGSTLAAQTLIPPMCGMALSLRINQKRFGQALTSAS